MTAQSTTLSFGRWLTFLCLGFGLAVGAFAAAPPAPKILSTRTSGTNLLVSVSIPRGFRAVFLETREQANAGAWVPRAVSRSAGRVVLKIPGSLKSQLLRLRGELREPLPAPFYRGKHAFAGRKSSFLRPDQGRGEVFSVSADGGLAGNVALPTPSGPTRMVEESDIWKFSGDTLYFFNQLRGLQIINVSNPDVPVVQGTLSLPAVGEDMYVLDTGHVLLLARDNSSSGDWQSHLLVVDVSGATPKTVATMPIPGWLQESRLVGTALYVAYQGYDPAGSANPGEVPFGTVVASFDLSNPASPIARSSLFYSGQANAVLATDRWLFVATDAYEGGYHSIVRAIDCSAADGTLRDVAGIAATGDVADKFKMNLDGNTFTVISERFGSPNGVSGAWLTAVETFSLAGGFPTALGRLDLAAGERLFATRFDGNRAYVVTFQRIDPLWVVDLSDPANPAVAGSVQVPGWSTYIQPLGNRLLTLGVETNRVAVSLFDVHDPTQPALLSRVLLGENYSWSQANSDEKALTVLNDIGLVLVPYQGTTTNGWTTQVQLIDLATDLLTARGAIQHPFAPRRTAAHGTRVISLSNEQLLSVDITDREHPVVRGETDLAWPVNQVFCEGEYVLELTTGNGWFGVSQPELRVALGSAPDTVLASLSLSNMPVAGVTSKDGRLFLLQCPNYAFYRWPILLGGPVGYGDGEDNSAPTNLLMTIVDVGALPSISVVGQVAVAPDDAANAGGNFQAVWPSPNLLVWFSTGFNYWMNPIYGGPGVIRPMSGMGLAVSGVTGSRVVTNANTGGLSPGSGAVPSQPGAPSGAPRPGTVTLGAAPSTLNGLTFNCVPYWWPWWGNGGVRLLAFDVTDPPNPTLASTVNFSPTNAWGFSTPFAAQGMIYFSHEQSDQGTRLNTGWRVADYLDVIDYTDPAVPTVRPPISIPGQLTGLSSDGAMLYLLGNALSAGGVPYETRDALNAASYDGTAAYLVGSLALPQTWPQPVLVKSDLVYLGRTAANGTNGTLEVWGLSGQGRFVRQQSINAAQAFSALAHAGPLLTALDLGNNVCLFDTSDSGLNLVASTRPPGGMWLDLNRAAASSSRVFFALDDYGVFGVPFTNSSTSTWTYGGVITVGSASSSSGSVSFYPITIGIPDPPPPPGHP